MLCQCQESRFFSLEEAFFVFYWLSLSVCLSARLCLGLLGKTLGFGDMVQNANDCACTRLFLRAFCFSIPWLAILPVMLGIFCHSKHSRYTQQSLSQACTVSVKRSMQAAPPNPSEARALIVQNVLAQVCAASATAAGFKASATLSVEKPKRLQRVRPTCPRVLASSRCILGRLPGPAPERGHG